MNSKSFEDAKANSIQRLAVDPHSNNIIYFGARSGHGLWKSTDYGVTWSNVASFKWPGEKYGHFKEDLLTSYRHLLSKF